MSSDVYAGSILIATTPKRVFDYVRVPENQVHWATNFVRSTRPVGGGRYRMETPGGEMTYRIEADETNGVVDFVFETPVGESVLPARATPHPAGALFTFAITRAPGMPESAWQEGMRGLDDELTKLKRLLEAA